jgi:hypothetical protein
MQKKYYTWILVAVAIVLAVVVLTIMFPCCDKKKDSVQTQPYLEGPVTQEKYEPEKVDLMEGEVTDFDYDALETEEIDLGEFDEEIDIELSDEDFNI